MDSLKKNVLLIKMITIVYVKYYLKQLYKNLKIDQTLSFTF